MQEKEEPLRHFGIPKKCHECEGLTKDGKQCKRPASCHLQCQHYCWQHASLHVKGKQCHDLPGPPDILFHQLHPYNKIPGQPERDVYITDEEWKDPVLEGNCAYWAVCQLFNARFMSIENFFRWMRDESPWYKEHPEVRRPVVGDGLRPEAINEFLQSHMRVKVGNKMMHLSVTDLAAPIVVNSITARQRQYFHAYLNSVTNDYDGPPGILLRGMAFFNRQNGQYRKKPSTHPKTTEFGVRRAHCVFEAHKRRLDGVRFKQSRQSSHACQFSKHNSGIPLRRDLDRSCSIHLEHSVPYA